MDDDPLDADTAPGDLLSRLAVTIGGLLTGEGADDSPADADQPGESAGSPSTP
jgi:hypothetical protein